MVSSSLCWRGSQRVMTLPHPGESSERGGWALPHILSLNHPALLSVNMGLLCSESSTMQGAGWLYKLHMIFLLTAVQGNEPQTRSLLLVPQHSIRQEMWGFKKKIEFEQKAESQNCKVEGPVWGTVRELDHSIWEVGRERVMRCHGYWEPQASKVPL